MNDLYPEITKAGGLHNALNKAFQSISSELRVKPLDKESLFDLKITYARIELKNKFSQIYLATNSKLYLPDFWTDGVHLANGATDDIHKLVESIHSWLTSEITTTELSNKYNFIKPCDIAESFDKNEEVEYAWSSYLNDYYKQSLWPFITLAKDDEILGKLFPFTSLNVLCFIRCTGYPYLSDTPKVVPLISKETTLEIEYEVRTEDNFILGTGNAEQALKIVKQNLPRGIQPAIKGTADDVLKN